MNFDPGVDSSMISLLLIKPFSSSSFTFLDQKTCKIPHWPNSLCPTDLAGKFSCPWSLIPAICPHALIMRARDEDTSYIQTKQQQQQKPHINKEVFFFHFCFSSFLEQNRKFSALLSLKRSWHAAFLLNIYFCMLYHLSPQGEVDVFHIKQQKPQPNIPVSCYITIIFRPHATRQRTVQLGAAVSVNEGCYGIIESICCPCTTTTAVAGEKEMSFCCWLGLILLKLSRAQRGLDFCPS